MRFLHFPPLMCAVAWFVGKTILSLARVIACMSAVGSVAVNGGLP